MKQAINVPFKLDENSQRVDETEAHDALREAIANCLTNADYNERRGVVFLWKEDGLHFSNPGGFRVDLEDAYIGGNSDPRNETMMKMFTLINIGERAGGGIPDMVKKWTAAGYGRPVLSEQVNPERSSIILPLEKESGSNTSPFIPSRLEGINEGINEGMMLGDNERVVLEAIASDPSITTSDIQAETNLSESTIYRTVRGLREKGVLRRVGSKKSGKWEITSKWEG